MTKNTIVRKAQREGHVIEGTLASGQTPKPGTHVSIKSDGTYEVWNGAADGEMGEVIIVMENYLLGMTVDDAYAASSRFFGHIINRGDEVLVRVPAAVNLVIGDKLIIDDGTGLCIETTGSPEMEVYTCLESTGGALAAEGLVLARRL